MNLASQVQPRNAQAARIVERFVESRSVSDLMRDALRLSTGERVLLVVYLLHADFGSAAQVVADQLYIRWADLLRLDQDNAREAARLLWKV